MRHQVRLQNAIKERYERLAASDEETIDHQVALTRNWINAQPELRAILAEAERVEPVLNYEVSEVFQWSGRTEAGRAWLVWRLMNDVATGTETGAKYQIVDHLLQNSTSPHVVFQRFAKQVLKPLFDYLGDQVEHGSAVIHVLQRYVARVEWYDRDKLYRRYEDAVTSGRVGEDVYNLDLQRFLFLDGGYITQAKARSASGEADLLGALDTDDPLICEGKLYDGGRRGTSYLANGFHQVIKYAHDYNKTVAHLVVLNLTERLLQFQTDGPAGAWAPYVENAGVRVHLIVVRAYPPAKTASKSGKATTVRVSREDLITLDGETDHGAPDHDTPTGSGS